MPEFITSLRHRMKHFSFLLAFISSIALPLGAHATGVEKTQAFCPPSASVVTPQQQKQINAQASNRGLLWEVEKNGKRFYLYGTMHLGKREWFAPGPDLKKALSHSRRVLLELDPYAPQTQWPGADKPLAPKGKPLYMAISPHWQSSINELARQACIPEQPLARMNVFSRLRTLGYAQSQFDGLHRVYSLERMLSLYARQHGLPIVAMETAASQTIGFQPESGAAAQRMVDVALEQLGNGTTRRVTQHMAKAWEKGDLTDLSAYETWCECAKLPQDRAMLVRANDDRNVGFAKRLVTEHQSGTPFLAAVGSLHMTGPKALPKLLAEQGFKLTRVY